MFLISVYQKASGNWDSILKSKDITLLTKVHIVKAMVFLVVMYGCESQIIKKAEWWRIDAFKLWCWRRLESSLDCKIKPVNLKVKVKLLSRVRLSATPWTVAYQAPPSMGFSRQEHWSGPYLRTSLSAPLWTHPCRGNCYTALKNIFIYLAAPGLSCSMWDL